MKKFLIALSIPILFSFSAQAANLSASDIEKAFIGKRLKWKTVDGYEGTVRYSKNGSARVTIKKPERVSDKGKWWIKGNRMCNQWEVVREGKPKCFSYKQLSDGSYKSNTGTIIK